MIVPQEHANKATCMLSLTRQKKFKFDKVVVIISILYNNNTGANKISVTARFAIRICIWFPDRRSLNLAILTKIRLLPKKADMASKTVNVACTVRNVVVIRHLW